MKGDRVLVVGGGQGIGEAVAAAYGERAVVWTRSRGVDAADPAQVRAAAAALVAAHGAPWALVHAVGDFDESRLLQMEAAAWSALVRSNLDSVFHTLQAVVPAMVAQKRGRVVLFGAAGIERGRGMTRAPAYFALKAAVAQLGRSLAAEVAPHGLTVNVVSPGLIAHAHSHLESQRRLAAKVRAGRLGTVADVVAVVRWLLDEAASYVTGENVTVDGGLQL